MSAMIPRTENRGPVYNVVLDIDEVLTTCDPIQTLDEALFFKKRGSILTAVKTHYVFPGVLETINWLYGMEDVRTSFYSSGSQERNRAFVEGLLERSLPEEACSRAKREVCILSKEDLNEFGKKDISRVLRPNYSGDHIENTVLIDDRPANFVPEQSRNFLFVPPTRGDAFALLRRKKDSYGEEGFKFLKCGMTTEFFADYSCVREPIDQGKKLYVVKRSGGAFDLHFLDRISNGYRTAPISTEMHQPLVSSLENIHQESLDQGFVISSVDDQETLQNLYDLVGSMGGKTQTICHRANRIYYVAGLLSTALSEARNKQIPLTHSLCSLQSERIAKESGDVPVKNFKESPRKDRYYHLGLDVLRNVNQDLELINPHNYEQSIQGGIPPEEAARLQELIQNVWE